MDEMKRLELLKLQAKDSAAFTKQFETLTTDEQVNFKEYMEKVQDYLDLPPTSWANPYAISSSSTIIIISYLFYKARFRIISLFNYNKIYHFWYSLSTLFKQIAKQIFIKSQYHNYVLY